MELLQLDMLRLQVAMLLMRQHVLNLVLSQVLRLRLVTVGVELGLRIVLRRLLEMRLRVGIVVGLESLAVVLLGELVLEVLLRMHVLLERPALLLVLLLLLLGIEVLGIVVSRRPMTRRHGPAIVHTLHHAGAAVMLFKSRAPSRSS